RRSRTGGYRNAADGWGCQARHAAVFGVRFRRRELKFRAVELVWNIGGATKAPPEPISACRHGGAAFQKCTAAPHDGSSRLALFRSEHAVLMDSMPARCHCCMT